MTSPEDHKLQNNNNYNNDVNQANGNHNNFNNANTKDGSNDYFVATGEWNNGFCFDLLQYSLSYHRCASINSTISSPPTKILRVFSPRSFAVFCFFPEKTCMGI